MPSYNPEPLQTTTEAGATTNIRTTFKNATSDTYGLVADVTDTGGFGDMQAFAANGAVKLTMGLAFGFPGLKQPNANDYIFFGATDLSNYFLCDGITPGLAIHSGGVITLDGVQEVFTATTDSTSNSTGSAKYNGGIGVAKSIYSGGDIACDAAGKGFRIKEGGVSKMGGGTLSTGTVTITNSAVKTGSRIFCQRTLVSGTLGHLVPENIIDSTSFDVNSYTTAATLEVGDKSDFNYIIFDPA